MFIVGTARQQICSLFVDDQPFTTRKIDDFSPISYLPSNCHARLTSQSDHSRDCVAPALNVCLLAQSWSLSRTYKESQGAFRAKPEIGIPEAVECRMCQLVNQNSVTFAVSQLQLVKIVCSVSYSLLRLCVQSVVID